MNDDPIVSEVRLPERLAVIAGNGEIGTAQRKPAQSWRWVTRADLDLT